MHPSHTAPPTVPRREAGELDLPCTASAYTLLEVMIGLAIFLVATAGILTGLLQARKISERALRDETALTIVQSYMEDIKGVVYGNIVMAAADSSKSIGTRTALKNNTASTLPAFNFRGTSRTSDDMTVQVTPVITKAPDISIKESVIENGKTVEKTTTRSVAAYLITLNYTWWVGPDTKKLYSGSGVVKTIRADMAPLVISIAFVPPK